MLSLRPITSRLAARLRRRDLGADAEQVRIIAPPTHWPNPPTIALDGEFDRIVRHHPDSKPEDNLSRLRDDRISQGGTRALLLKDILIADGSLLGRRGYAAIGRQRRRPVLQGSPSRFEEAAFCSSAVAERYFGHWLVDALSSELLAAREGWTALSLPNPNRPHEQGYRELARLHAHPAELTRVKRMWIFEDWELNADRAERLGQLRTRLQADRATLETRIFLSRGRTGIGRILANEPEVRGALESHGFECLDPEEMTPRDIVAKLRRARIIAGVEGSAFSHAIATAPTGAGLMVIQPPRHFNMVYKTYAVALGLRFACTVGEIVDGERFVQPLDRLLKTIALLDQAIVG